MTLKTPETRMTAARTRLLLDYPWFGSLAMRLRIERGEVPTVATDGTRLLYNPEFLQSVSDTELLGILAHEVLHCALLHPFRRGNRDHKRWNHATDYAINGELRKCGLTLPSDALFDSQYDGLPAETIYAQLPDKSPNDDQGEDSQPSTGTVEDAPQDSGNQSQPGKPETMTESDWKVAAEQASDVAKGCGNLPGGVHRAVQNARKITADWRALLREFIAHTVPSDYSWLNPNRRYIAKGIYLPGIVKDNCADLVIAVDTSGSISARNLSVFSAEIAAICSEMKPDKITVIYCDSRVNEVQEFTAEDDITLKAVGGGGTAFSPVFAKIAEMEDSPACLIYFTDLDSYDTPQEPEYPVLWVTDLAITRSGAFGQTIRISED